MITPILGVFSWIFRVLTDSRENWSAHFGIELLLDGCFFFFFFRGGGAGLFNIFISVLSLETLNLPQQIFILAQESWVQMHWGTEQSLRWTKPKAGNSLKSSVKINQLGNTALNPKITQTTDFSVFPHRDTPAQDPEGTSEESFQMPKSHQEQRWNIPNVPRGRRSTYFASQTVHTWEKNTEQHWESRVVPWS